MRVAQQQPPRFCLTTRHQDKTSQDESSEKDSAVFATSFTFTLCSGQQQIFQKKNKCIGKSDAEHGLTYSSKSIAPRQKKSSRRATFGFPPFSHISFFIESASCIFHLSFSPCHCDTDTAVSTERPSPNLFELLCQAQQQF